MLGLIILSGLSYEYWSQTEFRITGTHLAWSIGAVVVAFVGFQLITLIRTYRAAFRFDPHFQKHRAGLESLKLEDVAAYGRSARELLCDRRTIRRTRPNGDVAAFSLLAGRFAVFTADRKLRTYFAPWEQVLIDTPFKRARRTATGDDAWLALDEDEAAAVHAYLAAPLARPSRPLPATIDALLDEWKSVLNDVWHGYPYSEDDYTNDLVLRDMIEDVAALMDESSRTTLMEKVVAWDADFKRVTVERPIERPMSYLLGTVEDIAQPGRWWWERAPLGVDPTQGWSSALPASVN